MCKLKNIFVYENCNQLDVLCNKHHVSIYLFIYEILAFCINSNLKSVMNHFQQTIVHCTGVLVLMSVAGLYHYHYTLVRRDGTIVKYISLKEEIRQRQIMRMLIFSHSSWLLKRFLYRRKTLEVTLLPMHLVVSLVGHIACIVNCQVKTW